MLARHRHGDEFVFNNYLFNLGKRTGTAEAIVFSSLWKDYFKATDFKSALESSDPLLRKGALIVLENFHFNRSSSDFESIYPLILALGKAGNAFEQEKAIFILFRNGKPADRHIIYKKLNNPIQQQDLKLLSKIALYPDKDSAINLSWVLNDPHPLAQLAGLRLIQQAPSTTALIPGIKRILGSKESIRDILLPIDFGSLADAHHEDHENFPLALVALHLNPHEDKRVFKTEFAALYHHEDPRILTFLLSHCLSSFDKSIYCPSEESLPDVLKRLSETSHPLLKEFIDTYKPTQESLIQNHISIKEKLISEESIQYDTKIIDEIAKNPLLLTNTDLDQVLNHKNSNVRQNGLIALITKYPSAKAKPKLLPFLKDEEQSLRASAFHYLSEKQAWEWSELWALLNQGDSWLQSQVLHYLAAIKPFSEAAKAELTPWLETKLAQASPEELHTLSQILASWQIDELLTPFIKRWQPLLQLEQEDVYHRGIFRQLLHWQPQIALSFCEDPSQAKQLCSAWDLANAYTPTQFGILQNWLQSKQSHLPLLALQVLKETKVAAQSPYLPIVKAFLPINQEQQVARLQYLFGYQQYDSADFEQVLQWFKHNENGDPGWPVLRYFQTEALQALLKRITELPISEQSGVVAEIADRAEPRFQTDLIRFLNQPELEKDAALGLILLGAPEGSKYIPRLLADSDDARDVLDYLARRLKQGHCPSYDSWAAFLQSPPDWDYDELEHTLEPVLSDCVKQDKDFAAQLIANKAQQAEVLKEFIDKALADHPHQIVPAFFHSQAEILQKSLDVEEILSSLHWLGLSGNPQWAPLVRPFTGDKNEEIANKAEAVLNQLNPPKATQR